MVGKYRLQLKTKRLNYDLVLSSKITVISDKSATGKTTFVKTLNEYLDGVEGIYFNIESKRKAEVVIISNSRNWELQLSGVENSIVIVDELNFIYEFNKNFNDCNDKYYGVKYSFANYLKSSNNYFLFVCRHLEEFSPFPVHYKNIYQVVNKSGISKLEAKYDIKDYIIGRNKINMLGKASSIICEDSKSGFTFLKSICKGECYTAGTKDNIYNYLLQNYKYCSKNVLVFVDGCSFGSNLKLVNEFITDKNIVLYMPESFEYLLLNTSIFDNSEIRDVLDNISEYNNEYYETFYTNLLCRYYNEYLIDNNLERVYKSYRKGELTKTIFFTDKLKKEIIINNSLNELIELN